MQLATPKTRFMEDKAAANSLADLVTESIFIKAIDAALLQMSHEAMFTKTIEQAAIANHRLQGALAFVRILTTLADMPKPMPEQESGNLRWDA